MSRDDGDDRGAIGDIDVENPAFDVTPPRHVDAIVTERGQFPPESIVTLMRELFGEGTALGGGVRTGVVVRSSRTSDSATAFIRSMARATATNVATSESACGRTARIPHRSIGP